MYDRVIARETSDIFETQCTCNFDYASGATVANKRWTSDFVHSVWPLVSQTEASFTTISHIKASDHRTPVKQQAGEDAAFRAAFRRT